MQLLDVFPHVNAFLNTSSAVFLVIGFYFIRSRQIERHRASMLTAAGISTLFLISYLSHHALRTYYFGLGPTRFTGEGVIRPIYFTVLTSHTILAALVAPMVLLTLWRGLKGQFDRHRRVARIVFPAWLYVSVTGVVVYFLLYHAYPAR